MQTVSKDTSKTATVYYKKPATVYYKNLQQSTTKLQQSSTEDCYTAPVLSYTCKKGVSNMWNKKNLLKCIYTSDVHKTLRKNSSNAADHILD